MAISFPKAKKYSKRNGLPKSLNIKTPLPSPVHFYSLKQDNFLLEPTVVVGDPVLCGQKIADIAEFGAIPVIASISGVVISVSENVIEIENDTEYRELFFTPPLKPVEELTSREILWLLREGAVFEPRSASPLHVLLSEKKVSDCIIVCCFDSDPYVSSPQAAAFGNSEKIIRALNTAMRVSGVTKAYIAVENDTKKTFADFKLCLRYNEAIIPYLLKARYPQSQSDILIKTITGNADTNALLLSAETLVNMADTLEKGVPVTKKIVTVSGDDILEPENFAVPMRASVSSVLDSGGYVRPEVVIDGGIVDGVVITDLDEPVTPLTKAILAFSDKNNIPKYRKNTDGH